MHDATMDAGASGTWRDRHRGKRGHALMTEEVGRRIPTLGANEDAADADEVLAPVKFFSPYSGWRWYVTEWDAATGLCFGLVEGFETEWGYFGAPRHAA